MFYLSKDILLRIEVFVHLHKDLIFTCFLTVKVLSYKQKCNIIGRYATNNHTLKTQLYDLCSGKLPKDKIVNEDIYVVYI